MRRLRCWAKLREWYLDTTPSSLEFRHRERLQKKVPSRALCTDRNPYSPLPTVQTQNGWSAAHLLESVILPSPQLDRFEYMLVPPTYRSRGITDSQ